MADDTLVTHSDALRRAWGASAATAEELQTDFAVQQRYTRYFKYNRGDAVLTTAECAT